MHFSILFFGLGLWTAVQSAPTPDGPCEVRYVVVPAKGGTSTSASGGLNSTDTGTSAIVNGTSSVPVNSTAVAAANGTQGGVNLATGTGGLLQAPQPDFPVPADAAIYTPSGSVLDVTAFNKWTHATYFDQKKKYMKVAPGTYAYQSASDEFNKGMVFWLYDGATLDLRGCTFTYSADKKLNPNAPGNAIYLDVTDDFTILGGTFWSDPGELFSQARITSMTPTGDGDSSFVVMDIEKGYDRDVWKSAGPRNMECYDDSDPNHTKRPGCNFWYYSDIQLHDNGSVTAKAGSRANVKLGYVLTIGTGNTQANTIAAEYCAGLTVRGLTTNGNIAQYGLGGKRTGDYYDSLITNGPTREGFAPRVTGPTLSWGHIDNFNFCGENICPNFHNSFWQYTGNTKDLRDMATQTLPTE